MRLDYDIPAVQRLGDPRVWAVPLLAAAALLIVAMGDNNLALFRCLNGWGAVTGDSVWAALTVLGDTVVALALLAPFIGRRPDIIRAAVVAAVLATLYVHGLKDLLAMPRPPALLDAATLHIIGPAFKAGSFPSGHTTTIFTLAGVVALHFPGRWHTRSLAVLALLVGLSRSVVGVHWPVDVLAGAGGGWLAAVAGTWLARRWAWGLSGPAQALFAVLLLGCAATLLVGQKTGYGVENWQRLIAVVCLLPPLMRLFARRGAATPGHFQ